MSRASKQAHSGRLPFCAARTGAPATAESLAVSMHLASLTAPPTNFSRSTSPRSNVRFGRPMASPLFAPCRPAYSIPVITRSRITFRTWRPAARGARLKATLLMSLRGGDAGREAGGFGVRGQDAHCVGPGRPLARLLRAAGEQEELSGVGPGSGDEDDGHAGVAERRPAMANAPATTELARPMMSYGKDERHIHKHVWELPIPLFDQTNRVHRRISQLGADAEKMVATYKIDDSVHFSAIRRHIRDALFETPEGQELNELVFDMLG